VINNNKKNDVNGRTNKNFSSQPFEKKNIIKKFVNIILQFRYN